MIRRFICSVVHFLYIHLAKPVLFLSSPDDMHAAMIKFSNYFGKIPLFRGFLRLNFKGRKSTALGQEIAGVHFSTPVGLAAGFDKNGEILQAISCLGFGYEVVGSITAKQCIGNPRPWFYRLPKSRAAVINAGLANDGSVAILERISYLPSRLLADFPIVLSIARTNVPEIVSADDSIDDYILSVKRAIETSRIKIIEINISCPNSFGGEDFSSDPKLLDQLLSGVDLCHGATPVFLKMPVDLEWKDFKKLLDVAVKHQVSGVVIANLTKNRSLLNFRNELPESVCGNLSGLPTRHLGNELIRLSYLNYGDRLKIIGVGGIFSGADAYEKIRLGASMIQIITGLFFEGPQLAAQINMDITKYLKRDGFSSITEAIGVDAKNIVKS